MSSIGPNGTNGEVDGLQKNGFTKGTVQSNRIWSRKNSYLYVEADGPSDAIAEVNYQSPVSSDYY